SPSTESDTSIHLGKSVSPLNTADKESQRTQRARALRVLCALKNLPLFACEEVHHAVKEAFAVALWRDTGAERLRQLLEQVTLLVGQAGRDFHLYVDQLIAAPGVRAVAA